MTDIVFVILHYKSFDDTRKCVDSILQNINCDSKKIVIVDNGSGNGSGEKIMELYSDNTDIVVIFQDKNTGFSTGNNTGCEYAKVFFSPDFVCVINNDTVIEQKNFVDKIKEEFKKSSFDVLGPDIITYNDVHQNPYALELVSYKAMYSHLFRLHLLCIYYKFHLNKFKMIEKAKLYFSAFNRNNLESGFIGSSIRQENVALHGSAVIFSRNYLMRYPSVFYSRMFLYSEEDFLNYRRLKDNLKFVYSPDLRIYHKVFSDPALLNSNDAKRKLFRYKNSLSSVKKLLRLMKKEKFNFKI